MNLFLLYLLMLKASLTSFTGMGTLPMVRNDLVVEHHAITDRQLNTAVVAGRIGPGPYGIYLVCVGEAAAGFPGACAAFLALITPAFLVLPLLQWVGKRADRPAVKGAIQGVMAASSGLLLASSVPLAQDAIHGPLTLVLVIGSFLILSFTRVQAAWLVAGAAAIGLAAKILA